MVVSLHHGLSWGDVKICVQLERILQYPCIFLHYRNSFIFCTKAAHVPSHRAAPLLPSVIAEAFKMPNSRKFWRRERDGCPPAFVSTREPTPTPHWDLALRARTAVGVLSRWCICHKLAQQEVHSQHLDCVIRGAHMPCCLHACVIGPRLELTLTPHCGINKVICENTLAVRGFDLKRAFCFTKYSTVTRVKRKQLACHKAFCSAGHVRLVFGVLLTHCYLLGKPKAHRVSW